MNKISYVVPKALFIITGVILLSQFLLVEMSGIFVRKEGFESTLLVCFIAFLLSAFYGLAVVAFNASRKNEEKSDESKEREEILLVKNPEFSEWQGLMFGNKGNDGLVWRPLKGGEPNWFWRKMQYLILGSKWVKDPKEKSDEVDKC